jgi:hypothetical protein
MPESENSSSDNQDPLLDIGTWKLLIGLLLTIQTSWFLIYRGSAQVIMITITHRERVTQQSEDSTNSYYLVWSREGEVFQVKDDWRFLAWNSSDRYGQLQEGTVAQIKVAGWRVPFLSWYRNIVDVQTIYTTDS